MKKPLLCFYCGKPGRLYAGGVMCDKHSPWARAGRPNPNDVKVKR
jgi:hypothetical protein